MGTKKKSTDAAAPGAATKAEETKAAPTPKTKADVHAAIDEALNVPAPKRKAKAKSTTNETPAKTSVTLRELADRYIARLEEDGKSMGTTFSYRMEMRLALDALGEETAVAAIKTAAVEKFFASDRVQKTRTGMPKSPLSIAKTLRVVRQALEYAVEQGLIEKAPLPEEPAKA